jgi:predicted nucleotidyltransferase
VETDKRLISPRDIWDELPVSKLELIGGRLVAGNCLQPRAWAAALHEEEATRQADAARRDTRRHIARRAAELLRERFGVQRVVVIGDLVRPEPLHYWSEITLVAWGLPKERRELYTTLDELFTTPGVDVRAAEDALPRQQLALQREAVEL